MAPSASNDAVTNGRAISSHLNEDALQPFLRASYNHVDYLNSTFPALSTSFQSGKQRNGVSLAELTTHAQTTLLQLSASTSRLSDTLTGLTDDIVRSGSRLAYEVEILRGDAISLSETLDEGLLDDIRRFIPGRLDADGIDGHITADVPDEPKNQDGDTSWHGDKPARRDAPEIMPPPDLDRLRTLAVVKDRLESVVKVFGQAMEWTLPPSELSIASSFISVSGPDPTSDAQGLEEKGQAVSKKLRDEIAGLLASAPGHQGIDLAWTRVEELREVAKVWKGTAEERARSKFVDSLAKMVNEREKLLGPGASG